MALELPDKALGGTGDHALVTFNNRPLIAERKDRPHVVADVKFGPGRFSTCSCGRRFEGYRSDQEQADAFTAHVKRPAA